MNPSARLDRKSLLYSMFFLVLLVMISGGMAVYVMSDRSLQDALVMTAAAFRIDKLYRNDVDWKELVLAGRRAMFDRLDRYSTYYRQEQFQSLDEELEGSYSGIGVSVIFHEEGLMIMSVREDGPAAEVGLLSGDIIIAVDSVSLAGLVADESVGILRGEEGTAVRVEVWRSVTEELFEVVITRRRIPFMHIPFAGYASDSVIYIRMLDFDAGATADLEKAVDSLLRGETTRPKGLILDLRGNPGGLFAEGYRTADLFLDDGVFMVGTEGRSRWNNRKYYSTGRDITAGLPLAIIVDRGTASSAEIVSGALQASGRAFLVGDTTFGKGLVQGFVRFPDGDGLKLTISRYYFDGPVYLNDFDSMLHDVGHGLVPDYYIDVTAMNPVRRELENSLLLREFANKHQEAIVSAKESAAEDGLVESFTTYARDHGFSFTSPRTVLVDEMRLAAVVESSSTATTRLIEDVLRLSQAEDSMALVGERQYVIDRLRQIAFERKFGTYQSYRQVLLRSRPEITLASRILLEGH
ncbi:MAG: PDZ domain-containing protein [Candidatus Zixiibacteriota bacterium]|nr:MAG: PDZ domain-containing protein [candidate division Zixibacteria bacterium]